MNVSKIELGQFGVMEYWILDRIPITPLLHHPEVVYEVAG
jgi:hypothetical protein